MISVTQAQEKFLKGSWLKSGALVFPIGSYQECENEVILEADRIIVDHIGQALHRGALGGLTAQGLVSEEDIHATLQAMQAESWVNLPDMPQAPPGVGPVAVVAGSRVTMPYAMALLATGLMDRA